jgi:hypothetical protein
MMAATKKQSLLNVWVSSGHKECSGRNQMIQEINFAAASFCVRCSRVSGTPAAKTEPTPPSKDSPLESTTLSPHYKPGLPRPPHGGTLRYWGSCVNSGLFSEQIQECLGTFVELPALILALQAVFK